MADVSGEFYTGRKLRQGVSGSSPGNETGQTPTPVNPPGTGGDHPAVTIGSPANGLSITAGQVLSIGLASSGVTGALSGSDWDTFNGKIGGTIASGQVAFGTGTDEIGGSTRFIYAGNFIRMRNDNENEVVRLGDTGGLNDGVLQLYDDAGAEKVRLRADAESFFKGPANTFDGGDIRSKRSVGSLNIGFYEDEGSSVLTFGIYQSTASRYFRFIRYGGPLGTPNGNITVWDRNTDFVGIGVVPTQRLDVNGKARIRTINNLGTSATEVLVPDATGVVHKRTVSEFASDLGLTNGVTGTGTTNYIPKFTGASTIGDSQIFDNGTNVLIGSTTEIDSSAKLEINGRISQVGLGQSTFIGKDSGKLDDGTNNQNVFIGYESGYSNIIGGACVFLGYQSGYSYNASGTNTFIGYFSGRSTNTGSQNVFIGRNSGLTNTSGSRNSLCGELSSSGTTGDDNSIFGYSSGINLSSLSSNNCFFGSNAGKERTGGFALNTSSNSVIIGAFAKANNNSESNQIVIGYLAEGAGSNTVVLGNNSITDTYLKGNIHIEDAEDIVFDTTTGTKIGTATTQKLGFWNVTPIVQPTTSIAESTFVENSGGTNVNDDSTFDGYTIGQVVKALRNTGLLA